MTTEREIGGVISYTEELSDSSISYINTSAAAEQDTIRGDNNQTAPLVELQLGNPGMQRTVTGSANCAVILYFAFQLICIHMMGHVVNLLINAVLWIT